MNPVWLKAETIAALLETTKGRVKSMLASSGIEPVANLGRGPGGGLRWDSAQVLAWV